MKGSSAVRALLAVLLATATCLGAAPAAGAVTAGARSKHPAAPKPAALGKKAPAAKGSSWQKVLAEIPPDGQVSKQTALQAFALALGPLPGVKVPSGTHVPIRDGGEVVRWVFGHWSELSPAQQTAVQKALAGTPITDAGGHGRAFPRKASKVTTVVDEMLARYDGPLGHLSIPVNVSYIAAAPQKQPDAAAIAWPLNASDGETGTAAKCDVQITPLGATETGSDFEMYIAHELFHCYEGIWMGLDRYYSPGGSWAMEGAATWAGYNVAPELPTDPANWYFTWVATASKPLFAREHDAVGFFGQVAQWSVDLWPLFPKFFKTVGDVAEYHVLADANADKFLDAWGPGYWLSPSAGPAWRIEGKAAPPPGAYYSKAGNIKVGDGSSVPVTAAPYTVALYTGSPIADVTEVQVSGHGRLADVSGFDSTELTDTFLCTKTDGECTCPSDNDDTNGSNGLPASIQKVDVPLIMGLTGATGGTKGTVTGMSLDKWCKSRNQKKAKTACHVFEVATLDKITGLHITSVKDNGDSCVYADPSAPVSDVLKNFAGAITKAFTGTSVDLGNGAGVIVRLRDVPAGPEPQVSDYLDQIPARLCDTPQLVDGENAASAICMGVLNVGVVADGKFAFITYLAPGNTATHDQGAALARAAAERL
jgi:hypothetical protein